MRLGDKQAWYGEDTNTLLTSVPCLLSTAGKPEHVLVTEHGRQQERRRSTTVHLPSSLAPIAAPCHVTVPVRSEREVEKHPSACSMCVILHLLLRNYALQPTWSIAPDDFHYLLVAFRGTRWRSWLRHCATSRKVAGSIPDGVNGFFH